MFKFKPRKKKPKVTQASSVRRDFCRSKHKRCYLTYWSSKFLIGLGLLVGLSAVGVGSFIYFQKSWDGKETVSLAIQLSDQSSGGEKVFLVGLSPKDNSLSVVAFPDEMKVETVGGYGLWRIEAIYALGDLEKSGGRLLQKSLSQYMGTEVEGFIKVDEPMSFTPESVKNDLVMMTTRLIFRRGESNFRLGDLILILWQSRKVLPNRISWQRLTQSGILTTEIQPDGSETYFSHPDLLDELSLSFFSEPEMRLEAKSVIINNATEHGGLGSQGGRFIKNLGADLISVRDWQNRLPESEIVVADEGVLASFTLRKLKKVFEITRVSVDPQTSGRADISLVLGEDFWLRLTEL